MSLQVIPEKKKRYKQLSKCKTLYMKVLLEQLFQNEIPQSYDERAYIAYDRNGRSFLSLLAVGDFTPLGYSPCAFQGHQQASLLALDVVANVFHGEWQATLVHDLPARLGYLVEVYAPAAALDEGHAVTQPQPVQRGRAHAHVVREAAHVDVRGAELLQDLGQLRRVHVVVVEEGRVAVHVRIRALLYLYAMGNKIKIKRGAGYKLLE